ncbi:NYN domain-containing protein [Anaerofilum sp. BX8]|uniref:NYN domain-containing protein n=1 Tax=Anaerofilum hominis TaxID=2763016 RepID=A0A923L0R1_9FIRM|nr:NYN domain-containing protein [Anaerofilum hominis]
MQDNGKVIALLIDAENVSPKYIKAIVDEVAVYGTPAYKRIYGDWTSNDMANWKRVLLEHNLTPIQQFSYTQGKNASDSAMIIDAMDILYAGNVDGFCLVSSDSDFTKLASRLRESRMFVIGMGETKTPTAFKAACDTFKYLEVLLGTKTEAEAGGLPAEKPEKKQSEKQEKTEKAKKAPKAREKEPAKAGRRPEPQPEPEPPAPPEPEEDELETAIVPLSQIVATIASLIDHDCDEDGWMLLSQVGVMLGRMYADFDSRNYGYSRLHKLIEATGRFETKYEPLPSGGKNLMVRNR